MKETMARETSIFLERRTMSVTEAAERAAQERAKLEERGVSRHQARKSNIKYGFEMANTIGWGNFRVVNREDKTTPLQVDAWINEEGNISIRVWHMNDLVFSADSGHIIYNEVPGE